jgi:hypothetical protein
MGQRTATLLAERIADPELPPRRVVLPVELVLRSTHSRPQMPGGELSGSTSPASLSNGLDTA